MLSLLWAALAQYTSAQAASLPHVNQVIPEWYQKMVQTERSTKTLPKGVPIPAEVADHIDLRYRDTPIKSQFGGTCTAFGLVAAIENVTAKEKKVHLSERHFWSFYAQYSVDAAISAALGSSGRGRFVTTEEMWPQYNTRPYKGYLNYAKTRLTQATALHPTRSSGSWDTNETLSRVLQALNRGNPVYVGMAVPIGLSCSNSKNGFISPTASGTSGGHAMEVAGYEITDRVKGEANLILKNSWGTQCGDRGYFYMPMQVCKNKYMYCMFWEISAAESL